ncbi:unnamed protein product [Nezara viridula]|uniref:Uncharacterized protein n=1 Tax=Nezara viridula TaxID=85310 RepID=A0A9P0H2Q2_NEZVI|nr:unnamed protein product [Nezara viridula]
MTNSDKSFDTVDEDVWSIYEKDIEEIVVDSYSEEDIDDDISIELSPKPLAKEKEFERRKNINMMYSGIQKILGGGDAEEPRVRILKKATAACKQLCQEELHLKYETELLLQTNWKLKKRMEKLQKKKKRKSGSATISRRLSGPLVSSPIKTSPVEKRSASVDESKSAILPNIPTELKSNTEVIEVSSKGPPPPPKNPKRKVKKRTGLSDEEKEFYKMEEKLEDLLYEIDALWNDVNNDEEKDSKVDKNLIKEVEQGEVIPVDKTKPSGQPDPIKVPQRKEKIKLTDINKLIEPELNPNKHREEIKINNLSALIGESSVGKNVEVFKITNINKLLDPVQNPIIKSMDSSSFQSIINLNDKRRSSTSGDESPRLVIDENPRGNDKNNIDLGAIDMMEALQAVDTLCLSLVSDEPTTSESQPVVVEFKKSNNPIEKSDIIAISDSEDENASSDIVCLE